jgi:hypothetical protein
MRTRVGLLAVLATVVVAGVSSAAPTTTPKPLVWFAPFGIADEGFTGSVDYMDLFRPDAPWRQAASRVQIFKIAWGIGPEELKQVVADLKRRRIALAFEMPALVADTCGGGIEGFTPNSDPAFQLASRVVNAGGRLDYLVFDSPYFFGHVYDGPNACHWSEWKIAKAVRRYVKRIRTWFPKVVVGEIEALAPGVEPADLERWMDTYKRATRTRLAFLQLDLDFGRPRWAAESHRLQEAAHARGASFGIIYFGDGDTDEAWTAEAEQRFREYEASGTGSDHVIFQSWVDKPDYVLPETKPYTFTWLINRYFAPRP